MSSKLKIKLKGIAPIITVIILIVIGTIIITGILSWGKDFTNDSLSKTTSFGDLKAADAENFIYLKGLKDGVLLFNYNPPSSIKEEITITHYKLANVAGMDPVELDTPVTLAPNSLNIISLDCLYAYSVTGEVKLKLITSDNKYIDLTTRDPDLICTSGGNGSPEDPIVLCSAEDLDDIRSNLTVNYVLGKDIDLKCLSRESENGWIPIGDGEDSFSGSLDGKGYKINNLTIYLSETNYYAGLFNYTADSAILTNLNLEDVNISGVNVAVAGALVGTNSGGAISNCNSTGYVSGLGGEGAIGGLVGHNSEGAISNCSSTSSVSASFGTVGGLVGSNNGIITDSYSEGEVSGTGYNTYVGGLVGSNYGSVIESYSTSTVSGKNYVGGLVGVNEESEISTSYSTGSVSGTSNVGGLVGNSSYDSISNSYSESIVSATGDAVGGLIGMLSSSIISSCYSIGAVSGHHYIGGLIGKASGGEISDSNSSGDTSGVYAIGCLIGAVNSEGEPDIVDSTGTGLYECTGEECSEGCPIGGYYMMA